ncbi:MAG TPA: winged helix DNA-binding domain-containing protein [Roseiflexaceae bacterium]|nr:winged helix DNA-binding domain-containing protein [Roseiflexaceae bacterium]
MPKQPMQALALQRLHNQQLIGPQATTPTQVVTWQGAVQAQDYAGAKWAVGQRMAAATDATLDHAFAEGAILRTHVLRPTWHFVAPADIRWILALTAPHVHALNAYYYRKLELDSVLLARAAAVLTRALAGSNYLTRDELRRELRLAGIEADGLRLAYLIMHAELEALICSGPRRGKQFTYALLEERAPPGKTFVRGEALAELALRYTQSHGPVTVHDFVWWSGLSVADARAGLEALGSRLLRETIASQEYWRPSTPFVEAAPEPIVYLLPNYDEAIASYRDRSAAFDNRNAAAVYFDRSSFPHLVAIDGQLAGTWKRTIARKRVTVALQLFRALDAAERLALDSAVDDYGLFLELPAAITEIQQR